jgi:hypothetical protein
MGRRGPAPRSGIEFRGREVVLRGRTAAIHVESATAEHAIADARGYVSIHRLVASEALGRWVTRAEVVSAIDGDPWNWDPRNLRVRPLAASFPRRPPKVSRSTKPGSASRRRAPRPPQAPKASPPKAR